MAKDPTRPATMYLPDIEAALAREMLPAKEDVTNLISKTVSVQIVRATGEYHLRGNDLQ
jgi:hypothetical protein